MGTQELVGSQEMGGWGPQPLKSSQRRGCLDSAGCPAATPGRVPLSLKSHSAEPRAVPQPSQLFQGTVGESTRSLRQATCLGPHWLEGSQKQVHLCPP